MLKFTYTLRLVAGVRKGVVLSPNVFKHSINDLTTYIYSSLDPVYLNHKRLDCLMYVDDVILCSCSSAGLQSKLDLLQALCEDWRFFLLISIKQKWLFLIKLEGSLNHNQFRFNKTISCTAHCKYLGILFSASGTFTPAKNQLYDKSVKALYSLKLNVISLKPDIKPSINIFDHTIKPILLNKSVIFRPAPCLRKKYILMIYLILTKLPEVFILKCYIFTFVSIFRSA